MSQSHQKQISKYFPNRPTLYQPGLSLVFKSVNTGLLLSQLIYWHDKGRRKDGWIYKTTEELKQETGLTRTQQETAIRICRTHGVLDYKIAGIPAKRHFKLNLTLLEDLLPGLKQKVGIVYMNPPRQFAENLQTITESTQETTTKNIRRSKDSSIASIGKIIGDKYGDIT